ncbi:MAG: serine hydrolase [Chloroflexi bacterium]|nr:MAG: serine hydrolase [Chloroflexota bacterium]
MRSRPALILGTLIALVSALNSCGGDSESKPPGVLTGGLPTRSPGPFQSPVAAAEVQTQEPTQPPRSPMVVSLAWLDNSPAVPELPSSFAAQSPDAGLQAAIETALAGREGSYSVVVHNLADGRAASLNADKVYYAASLYKLEVLLEAYRQRDGGQLDFGSLLTLEKKYVDLDLKTLDSLEIIENDMVTVQDAVRAMTIVSDTPTAALLQDTVNAGRIDETLASLGLGSTESANRDLPTTARDMARLLTAIAAGEGGVNAGSRLEMLSLLEQEGYRAGVVAGVPSDTVVAHKTGSYSDATHDVALVWGPKGPYVIAVLTDRSYDWDAIREVSRAVWDYFAAQP